MVALNFLLQNSLIINSKQFSYIKNNYFFLDKSLNKWFAFDLFYNILNEVLKI